MNHRFPPADGSLPPELAALDAELSSIRYEERPSFAPELEAELARAWASPELEGPRLGPRARLLAAASVSALLLAGVAVPGARAAIVRLVGSLPWAQEDVAAPAEPQLPVAELPPEFVYEPSDDAPEPATPMLVAPEPPPSVSAGAPEVGRLTPPDLIDRAMTERLIRRYYPEELQRAQVGGVVRLRLWVEPGGAPRSASVVGSSGFEGLDRAALVAAPFLRFLPARRDGLAVGTWVEFDVFFEPEPGTGLPDVRPLGRPDVGVDPGPGSSTWSEGAERTSPSALDAGALLAEALGDPDLVSRLGPIETILAGNPPGGVGPTQWRVEVSAALTEAISRHPDNPAPLLALGRIRRKQGLRTDARLLFERGLERALRGGAPPTLLADLHYERGTLFREGWVGSWRLGSVPAEAMPAAQCPAARSTGGAVSGHASVDRLIAWNYLCPSVLDRIFETRFSLAGEAEADRALMAASFQKAIEAVPAHVGANLEILLAGADEGRWEAVLRDSRRFLEVSGGHPTAWLMQGLALQRLGRTEEAEEAFAHGLERLSPGEADRLRDIEPLLDPERAMAYRALSGPERREWERSFWAPLDPIASTPVNERAVEHLARTAFAQLRFGGVETDPGTVWVRYGRPDAVRAVGRGADLRTEFWDYGSAGPDMTFRRMATAATLDLTPEGRSYVEELREVYPHQYGANARVVRPLAGQVARFRGTEPGTVEIRVRSDVPGEALGRAGALELGVFYVAADGGIRRQSTATLAALSGPIDLAAVVPADAREVRVELFRPTTGDVWSLATPLVEAARGPSVSDPLVVRAVAPPEGALDRRRGWIAPLSLSDALWEDRVGVLFELYDLPPGTDWYQVRAEVRNEERRTVVAVPLRPAGPGDFRATWNRSVPEATSAVEYFELDLTELPPGRYTARLIVDLPGGTEPLQLQRILELR